MKLLLIHPQLKNYQQPKLPPLGILYIAAVLEQDKHQVRILDLNVTPHSLQRELKKKPDIVGITATTPLIKEAWRIAKLCQAQRLPVIFGGPHVSALPEETLQKRVAQLVVRHEGEETMREICRLWPNYSRIKGISFLKNGKVVHTPDRQLNYELDKLPFPAYHLLPDISAYSTPQPVLSKPRRTLTIITSRGCPYHCNYCYKGVFGDRWRAHSAEYVVNLWEYLVKRFNIEEVGVEDDTFNLNEARVKAICTGLIKRKIKTFWTTAQGLRADRTTKSMLTLMQKTGFYRTGFGIESGSQERVNAIGKNLDLKKVRQAVSACRDLGIECMGYFIIGNSGENQKTMQDTINFAISLDPDIAHFTIANPLPGSPLFEEIKSRGKFLVRDWNLYGYTKGKCLFEMGEVKQELVEKMWRRAYRSFYLRPKVIGRFIIRRNTWLNIPNMLKAVPMYLGFNKQ